MGEVINTTSGPITNLQVQVLLVAQDDTPVASAITLAAADYLAPNMRAPFAVLFKKPPDGVADVKVNLLRGEAISAITADFVPLDVVGSAGAVSGPQYRVSGQVVNNAGVAVERISIVVALYDGEGRVMGYRQAVSGDGGMLSAGRGREFELMLTPQGTGIPASFQVIAWAVSQTQ
jgi:hypothetical protein